MDLTYQSHPDVMLGPIVFRNVPTILQYEQTPVLEVVKVVEAGYETRFPIFSRDGIKLGVVTGSRLVTTKDGDKANIVQHHEANITAWELDGRTILELRRTGASALKGAAELYATDGVLIKSDDAEISAMARTNGNLLRIGSLTIRGGLIEGNGIGLLIRSDGILQIGNGCTARLTGINTGNT